VGKADCRRESLDAPRDPRDEWLHHIHGVTDEHQSMKEDEMELYTAGTGNGNSAPAPCL
jgi:hypothetical protein